MKRLLPLKPKTKLLTDFFVFDVETEVSYTEWCKQRKQQKPEYIIPAKRDGIYWGLNPNPKAFRIGVLHGLNYEKVFYNVDDLRRELRSEKFKGKKVFAHNAFYDLSTLYENIYLLDPTAIFNGSRFISCTNGNCLFADSYNIYQTSVAKIGKLLGIEKPDLGDEFFSESLDAGVINRCSVDCRIVWEALLMIFEMAGDIKITQASLSMTYFRRHHQKQIIEHNENEKYFWDSYYGGRCEAFKFGKTDSVVYDINSSYPRAMRDCVFPNPKFLKIEYGISVRKSLNILKHFEGCIYCKVEHKKTRFGYLPLKQKGKLYFPVGVFSGCWNFNELRYALESGSVSIKNVTKVVYADRYQSPFTEYVNILYQMRSISIDEFEKYRIKIFMNSLYGKFAQRILEETMYLDNIESYWELIENHKKNGTFIKLSMFNSKRLDCTLTTECVRMKNLSYSIPSFSSYITSYSRVVWLKKAYECEHRGVVYGDTDSLAIENDFGMVSSTELGEWKKEGAINKKTGQYEFKKIYEVHGLKNYVYYDPETGKTKHRIKGVPENAIKTGENSYEYFNLMKTKESLRRNTDIKVVRRTKVISGDYEKRVVFADGTTEPVMI